MALGSFHVAHFEADAEVAAALKAVQKLVAMAPGLAAQDNYLLAFQLLQDAAQRLKDVAGVLDVAYECGDRSRDLEEVA